jgi:hypothetical protein
MELQNAFYILAIVFMSLMLLIMIAIVIAIFVIKSKINAIHRRIEEKLAIINNIAHFGGDLMRATKKVVSH